jgi:spore coat polysaccharide biosynthesis protein SpsF
MKIAAIIQARMGSKRFPGKVMADLCGKPVLQHVIERTKEIGFPVFLSTPDSELAKFSAPFGVWSLPTQRPPFLSGDYLRIAGAHHIDLIVRITGDCPLLRPDLCQKTIDLYKAGFGRWAAIGWPEGGFPKGYGCEVFSQNALEAAVDFAEDDYDREHVTPWIYRHLPGQYLQNDKDESHLNYSIDTPEDLERVRMIVQNQMIDT